MRSSSAQKKFRQGVYDANIQEDHRGRYFNCAGCGMRINPATEAWEADHSIRLVLSKNNDPATNGQVLCKVCHRVKTGQDNSDNARGKRTSSKNSGIDRKKGFRGHRKFNGDLVWKR